MSAEIPAVTPKPAISQHSAEVTGAVKASSIAPSWVVTPFKELGSRPIGSHIATKRVDYLTISTKALSLRSMSMVG